MPAKNRPDLKTTDWCGPCNAALEERERIIALLEMQLETIRNSQLTGVVVLSSAIALIKGEN